MKAQSSGTPMETETLLPLAGAAVLTLMVVVLRPSDLPKR